MRFRQVDGSTSHFSLQLPSRDRLDRPLGPGVSVLTGYRNAAMSASVKTFGCRPRAGGAAHSGAGVRKPPREETVVARLIVSETGQQVEAFA
jgi:hypothetical protein